MLDLFHTNVRGAYSSSAQLIIISFFFSTSYKPIVQRQPVSKRTVRTWSQKAEETLQECFEATDRDALCEPHGDDNQP